MNPQWLWVAAVCVAACAAPAQAAFHDFRIDQVFSNADGSVQYVVMRESLGNNGENLWLGQVLRTTNVTGASKQLSFPTNLPSASTASRSALIATADFAALGLVTPDFTMPARLIPTNGGHSISQVSIRSRCPRCRSTARRQSIGTARQCRPRREISPTPPPR
jgi:hypothetical protein